MMVGFFNDITYSPSPSYVTIFMSSCSTHQVNYSEFSLPKIIQHNNTPEGSTHPFPPFVPLWVMNLLLRPIVKAKSTSLCNLKCSPKEETSDGYAVATAVIEREVVAVA